MPAQGSSSQRLYPCAETSVRRMRGAGWREPLHSGWKFSSAARGWSGLARPACWRLWGQSTAAPQPGGGARGGWECAPGLERAGVDPRPCAGQHRSPHAHAESRTAGHSAVDSISRVSSNLNDSVLAAGAKAPRAAAEHLLCWLCEGSDSNRHGNGAPVCSVAAQARGRCHSCSQVTSLSPGCPALLGRSCER